MRVGSIEIQPVLDGAGHEVAAEVLRRPGTADPWSCHADVLGPGGILRLDLGGFLVRTADRTVLVDAGAGTIERGRYTGGRLLDSLRACGVTPGDITDVAFTHLHFDHVGWATQKGQVVFPNATYHAHTADWAHFVESPDAQPGAVRKLSPLAGRMETFDREVTLAPGLTARPAAGHTPGSTVFVVSSGGERALLLGDVVHSVVELAEPDWEAVFDLDPVAASAVRNAVAGEVADSADLVAGGHFPGLRFGRVVTVAGARTFRAI